MNRADIALRTALMRNAYAVPFIEAAFLPRLCWGIVRSIKLHPGIDPETANTASHIMACLEPAWIVPMAAMDQRRAKQAFSLLVDTIKITTDQFAVGEHRKLATWGATMVFHLGAALIDAGYMAPLEKGTPLQAGIDGTLLCVSEADQELFMAPARKHARRVLLHLQALGLYKTPRFTA
jgi:hypothetical protein